MSFFDNPKNFGLAAVVIGIVSILAGIVAIVKGAIADPFATVAIVTAVGTLIYGFLILGIGRPIYKGEDTNAFSILAKFVNFVGLATIVVKVFEGIGQIIDKATVQGVTTIVIGIVLGFILMWISKRMTDGSTDTLDKIIWIALLVVFVVLTIVSLVGIFTPFLASMALVDKLIAVVLSLCQFVLYAFLLVTILSKDVKSKMGV